MAISLSPLVRDRLIVALCVLITCGILGVGLWPFNPIPPNEVTWIPGENGLRFGDYAYLVSIREFPRSPAEQTGPGSLEIWMQPGLIDDSNTFLEFYSPDFKPYFALHQLKRSLVLVRQMPDGHDPPGVKEYEIEQFFTAGRSVFITITAGSPGLSVYRDGILAGHAPHFGLSLKDFEGGLVVGNGAISNDSWSGLLRGLAIYNQPLSLDRVTKHVETWTNGGRPEAVDRDGIVALYLFSERSGRKISNAAGAGPDLSIPPHYEIVHKRFFTPFWEEFLNNLDYWKDVAINVGGFIPLGFCYFAYFFVLRKSKHPLLWATASGSLVSITIEFLQGFLPMRSSGMTDVITNTSGTFLGALILNFAKIRKLMAAVGIEL